MKQSTAVDDGPCLCVLCRIAVKHTMRVMGMFNVLLS